MRKLLALLSLLILAVPRHALADEPIRIVAAENFYGDIARQIGGSNVKIINILSNPDQDPHLFEASASAAQSVSAAAIVIYNGIDYDPWMEKLLAAARNDNRQAIAVAELAGHRVGDNPHIWYEPATMLALARKLTAELGDDDPFHQVEYRQNLAAFEASLQPVTNRIEALQPRTAGLPVTATEPVFGYMLAALGMEIRNQSFQLAVMNNTEPSASELAAFMDDLQTHQVKMLIYNSQASDPMAVRMEKLAKTSDVPIVAVTETEPKGGKYQDWMLAELAAVEQALPR